MKAQGQLQEHGLLPDNHDKPEWLKRPLPRFNMTLVPEMYEHVGEVVDTTLDKIYGFYHGQTG